MVDSLVPGMVFGLIIASVLAPAAVGFSMQYGITSIFNLAFAEVMIVSAFVALVADTAGAPLPLVVATGALAGAAISVLLNTALFTPFVRRGTSLFGMLIVTLAVSLMLANGLLGVTGASTYSFDVGRTIVGAVGTTTVSNVELLVIVAGVVSMVSIGLLLRFSQLGRAMRATSVDPVLARSSGVPTTRVTNLVWAISGVLCGLSGVMFFLSTRSFSATSGRTFIVLVIAAAVLGGVGDAYGAMLGAVVIGLATEVGGMWVDPGYKTAIALLFLLGVLLVRPQGIRAEFARVREVEA